MQSVWRALVLVTVVGVLATACAPAQGVTQPSGETRSQPAARKRVTAMVLGDVYTLSQTINNAGAGGVPGVDALQDLVHAGLGVLDGQAAMQPRLAEAVPSAENGLWKVNPDGTMETTWRLRAGVRWQDGTPLTTDDLLFTAQVARDKDLAILIVPAFDLVREIEALDPQTLRVTWRTSYIEADRLFSAAGSDALLPMPRHLLERTYQASSSAPAPSGCGSSCGGATWSWTRTTAMCWAAPASTRSRSASSRTRTPPSPTSSPARRS
jgi:ABC-type transport system substrate-binding protein